jgi:hypothetical protein
MANQGAKKRLEENARRLRLLQTIIAVSAGLYAFVNLYLRSASASWWTWTGYITALAAFAATYGAIAASARPVYDERGEMQSGGADLNMGGMNSYFHDLLYLTGAVLLLTCASPWFWLLYLLAPGFALYKLWVHVLWPYLNSDKEPAMDEATRKKMEKAQARAERRARKW